MGFYESETASVGIPAEHSHSAFHGAGNKSVTPVGADGHRACFAKAVDTFVGVLVDFDEGEPASVSIPAEHGNSVIHRAGDIGVAPFGADGHCECSVKAIDTCVNILVDFDESEGVRCGISAEHSHSVIHRASNVDVALVGTDGHFACAVKAIDTIVTVLEDLGESEPASVSIPAEHSQGITVVRGSVDVVPVGTDGH